MVVCNNLLMISLYKRPGNTIRPCAAVAADPIDAFGRGCKQTVLAASTGLACYRVVIVKNRVVVPEIQLLVVHPIILQLAEEQADR